MTVRWGASPMTVLWGNCANPMTILWGTTLFKPGSFAFKSCVKYLIDKKLPAGSSIKTLCNDCFGSIKDKSVESIETGQGKIILFTMDNGSTRVQLQGKGSANRSKGQVITDEKTAAGDNEDSDIGSTEIHRSRGVLGIRAHPT